MSHLPFFKEVIKGVAQKAKAKELECKLYIMLIFFNW